MILGKKEVLQNLEKLSQLDIYDATEEAAELVRKAAEGEVPVYSGELQQSIYKDVKSTEYGATGEVFTEKEYAELVEFGTGPIGQENHEGTSPDVHKIYKPVPWWIHEKGSGGSREGHEKAKDIDKEVAERYSWPHSDTPNGRFYLCSGQPAQPFMYPAIANHTDEIEEIYAKKIREVMK